MRACDGCLCVCACMHATTIYMCFFEFQNNRFNLLWVHGKFNNCLQLKQTPNAELYHINDVVDWLFKGNVEYCFLNKLYVLFKSREKERVRKSKPYGDANACIKRFETFQFSRSSAPAFLLFCVHHKSVTWFRRLPFSTQNSENRYSRFMLLIVESYVMYNLNVRIAISSLFLLLSMSDWKM